MMKALGIRFQPGGKVYALDPGSLAAGPGTKVAVEGEAGVRLGKVIWGPQEVAEAEVSHGLTLRLPTSQDAHRARDFDAWANSCLTQAQEMASQQGLPLKMWVVEPDLDRRRFTIYFSAPARVDFRGLVRELSSRWKARVELHQLGARDESRLLGGLGRCGQPACCARFLNQFTSVSIRMAREQDIAPNPEKLSGLCDRLLCCLSYELETYHEASKRMPRLGRRVSTPSGPGVVTARNLLKETVSVALDESKVVEEWPLSHIAQP